MDATGQLAAPHQVVLSFSSSGLVTEVLARDGDEVASGQPLARVDPSDLALRVELARVQLGSAQARMAQIQESPTKSDLASAQQGLILAQTALINAVRTYTDMRTGGSFSDVASARQALASAESAIIQATDHLNALRSGANPEQVSAPEGSPSPNPR